MSSQPDVGLEAVFEGFGAQFLEPRRGCLRERGVEDVPERGAAPECQRLGEQLGRVRVTSGAELTPSVRGESLEAIHVDVGRVDGQPVATGTGFDRPWQDFPQPRHQRLQRVRRVGGRLGTPQAVDQRVGRDDPSGVEREPGDEHAQPGTADVGRRALVPHDPHGAQQRDAHVSTFPDAH